MAEGEGGGALPHGGRGGSGGGGGGRSERAEARLAPQPASGGRRTTCYLHGPPAKNILADVAGARVYLVGFSR